MHGRRAWTPFDCDLCRVGCTGISASNPDGLTLVDGVLALL